MGLILGSGSTKPQYPYDQWYGVQGDTTSSDYKLTRVGNLDLHRTLPIQNKLRRFVENEDGSVKYYLGQNDSRTKEAGALADITGADGNVMLEIPEFYVRIEIHGTKWIYGISEHPLPGFTKIERMAIAPWYSTYNQETSKPQSGSFLTWNGDEVARGEDGLPIFTAGAEKCRGGNNTAEWDGTYRSLIGMGRTNIPSSTIRDWCAATGNGIHHGAFRAYNHIAWLQRIEYASLHCQDTYTTTLTGDGFRQGGLGSGCVVEDTNEWNKHCAANPFIPGGVTAPIGNNTGKVNYTIKNWANSGSDKTFQVTSYRGFEVPFEYLYMLADDILIHHSPATALGKSRAYLCTDPTKFTSHSKSAEKPPVGYEEVADLPYNPHPTALYSMYLSLTEKGIGFNSKILGGSSNKGCCDLFYCPGNKTSGWYLAVLSGNARDGVGAGFSFMFTNYITQYANNCIGFRLCRN